MLYFIKFYDFAFYYAKQKLSYFSGVESHTEEVDKSKPITAAQRQKEREEKRRKKKEKAKEKICKNKDKKGKRL